MQFSAKEDIDAPADRVFAMLSEFEMFERAAMRRGIDVRRVGDPTATGPGRQWNVSFQLRGKPREMLLVLTESEPPERMVYAASSEGLEGAMTIDLVALSPRRTRIAVEVELKPKTLSARVMVQSMKLAKSTMTKRFRLKVAEFAKSLEDRSQRSA